MKKYFLFLYLIINVNADNVLCSKKKAEKLYFKAMHYIYDRRLYIKADELMIQSANCNDKDAIDFLKEQCELNETSYLIKDWCRKNIK